jgi:hypothetical protein
MSFPSIPSSDEVVVHSNFLRQYIPVSSSEFDRVKTLRETNLVDTIDSCEMFERYVRLMSRVFKVTITYFTGCII